MRRLRLPRLRPLTIEQASALRVAAAVLLALGAASAWVIFMSPRLALTSLAALGLVAAIGALGSADHGKSASIAGALTTFALLAFAALAMIAPAVLL